jgi:tyrosyl-tRNA synthetase
LGGQDQWGNIVAGIDLTRRLGHEEVSALTFPLLLKSSGEKFGKTASGAVWLDPDKTTPYHYYQFWRNVEDAEVERMLAFFTTLPMTEVRALAALEPPRINRAKEVLAYEATALAHGPKQAGDAFLAAGAEFGFSDPEGQIQTSSDIKGIRPTVKLQQDVPEYQVATDEVKKGIGIITLLKESGLTKSNSDARRLITQGGCYLNGERVSDVAFEVQKDAFEEGKATLKAGKKKVRRLVLA